MSAEMGFESLRLPAGERLVLVGTGLVFEVADGWWAGPAVYGAATGLRAGLFVGGAQVERRWAVGHGLSVDAGVFVGGGGGGNAPVGSGLMWRPSIALLKRWDALQIGVSLSDVRFPSGTIHGTQVGLVMKWDGSYPYYDSSDAGRSISGPGTGSESESGSRSVSISGSASSANAIARGTGFGIDKVIATVTRYDLRDGSGRKPGLLGTRIEWRDAFDDWHTGFEAAAAAHGDAAGYMELLGSVGYDHRLTGSWPGLRVGVRGAVGLGGGGAIPGGGGAIAKALGTFRMNIAPGWQAGFEAGWLDGLHDRPRARIAQFWVATELGSASDDKASSSSRDISRNEWVATVQHFAHATRKAGTSNSIDTIGGGFNHYLGESVYLTAQAHSAFAGGAGAFSAGLVGAGIATKPGAWRAGAEIIGGAAGGGGVATLGGAIAQATTWAEAKLMSEGSLRLGLGFVRSSHQGLSSPIYQLSWSQAFGLADK